MKNKINYSAVGLWGGKPVVNTYRVSAKDMHVAFIGQRIDELHIEQQ